MYISFTALQGSKVCSTSKSTYDLMCLCNFISIYYISYIINIYETKSEIKIKNKENQMKKKI